MEHSESPLFYYRPGHPCRCFLLGRIDEMEEMDPVDEPFPHVLSGLLCSRRSRGKSCFFLREGRDLHLRGFPGLWLCRRRWSPWFLLRDCRRFLRRRNWSRAASAASVTASSIGPSPTGRTAAPAGRSPARGCKRRYQLETGTHKRELPYGHPADSKLEVGGFGRSPLRIVGILLVEPE